MNQTEFLFPQPPAPALRAVSPQPAPEDDEPLVFEEAEAAHQSAYAARLIDYPHPTADAVKVAEQRFRRELDRQLGGDVLAALRAYRNVMESGEGDLTKEDVVLASRWAKAFALAITAGFRDLGDTDEAYFEVRMV